MTQLVGGQYIDPGQVEYELGPLLMRQTIRKNTLLEQAVTEKINPYVLDPLSAGALDYTTLTGEILARLT